MGALSFLICLGYSCRGEYLGGLCLRGMYVAGGIGCLVLLVMHGQKVVLQIPIAFCCSTLYIFLFALRAGLSVPTVLGEFAFSLMVAIIITGICSKVLDFAFLKLRPRESSGDLETMG
jgi:hypothetical protein